MSLQPQKFARLPTCSYQLSFT